MAVLSGVAAADETSGTTVAGREFTSTADDVLKGPSGVAVDAAGNVYVADSGNHRVRRWAPGAVSGVTVAGTGVAGSAPNQLSDPTGVAVDAAGNVYVADNGNQRVQRWAPGASSGETVAGGNGRGSAANQFDAPYGVAVDAAGNVYVADVLNFRVQRWAPGASSGVTVAGGNGEGEASHQLRDPQGVAVDAAGNVYVADTQNDRVQLWAPGAAEGITVAGCCWSWQGHLFTPKGVAVDAFGKVYVADTSNHRVQLWEPGAEAGRTVAGGKYGNPGSRSWEVNAPHAVAVDAAGNFYVADTGNNRVQRWSPGAQSGVQVAGFIGRSGFATDQLASPQAIVLDAAGNLYITDTGNHRIQRWSPGATAGVTLAGTGAPGRNPDQLSSPGAVAVDASGNVYVADLGNSRVQKWAPGATTGVTVAGGNGYGAEPNQLKSASGVAVDASGNVYVADADNSRVQKWAPEATSGVTMAGIDGVEGSDANQLSRPGDLALDAAGNLYVADTQNNRVQKWAPGATSGTTVAGGNGRGGDASQLSSPDAVAVDAAGNVYVADRSNRRVQRWAPGATSGVTVAGNASYLSGGEQLGYPDGVAVDAAGNVYVAESTKDRVRAWSPEPTTVTAASASVNYPSAVPTIGYSTSPPVVAGDWTTEPSCAVYAQSDGGFTSPLTGVQPAGTYVTRCSGGSRYRAPGDPSLRNMSVRYVNGTLTVTKAPITVTAASPAAIEYGTTVPSTIGWSSNPATTNADWLFPPQCYLYAASDTSFRNPGVGQTAGTYVTHCSGGWALSYAPTYVDGSFTINQAEMTVTAESPAETYESIFPYGFPVPPIGYTTSPPSGPSTWKTAPACAVFDLGDTSFARPLTGVQPVGNYVTHCSGASSSNYKLKYQDGAWAVDKADLSVTAKTIEIVYPTAVPSLEYQTSPATTPADWTTEPSCAVFEIGDTSYTTPLTGVLSPYSYRIHCSGGIAPNYTILKAFDGVLRVKKIPLIVTATSPAAVFAGTMPSFGYSTDPAVSPADWRAPPSCAAYASSDTWFRTIVSNLTAGLYTTHCSGGDAANYLPTTYVNGTLRVLELPKPTVVAGTGIPGSSDTQLSNPYAVAVDATGHIYIADTQNHRVQRWAPGATSGVTVAGGNGSGTGGNQLSSPRGVAVDSASNVYVADLFNNRVQRWAPGATSGVTVAGGNGSGSGANQLKGPLGVAIDATGNIYVADTSNHRVQRWAPDALSGVTVAGTGIAGYQDERLDSPSGVAVDASGNVYVIDTFNFRVQRWAPGAASGEMVAGTSQWGTSPDQFDEPYGVALDPTGTNLYVADTSNHRITRFAFGVELTLTAASASVGYGTAVPTVGYSTSPATVPSDWSTPPTCGVFASSDTSFAMPLSGIQPVGSYVTHCAGGTATNYFLPTSGVNGTFTVTQQPVTVTAQSTASVLYGASLPAIGYSTSPTTVPTDWTAEPTCGVFTAADTSFTTPLAGIQPVGSYVTHCVGGTSVGYAPTSWVNSTYTITKSPVTVTSLSPTPVSYGTALPTVSYSTSPTTVPTDWTAEPTCRAFTTADTSFATPLTGVQPVGSYVTHCAGGTSKNFVPTSWVDGTLAVTQQAVVVTAASPTSAPYGTVMPAVGYSTSPKTNVGDWTIEPTCASYRSTDTSFTTPLTGVQPVGSYVTHCAGGTSERYLPASFVAGSFSITNVNVTIMASSPGPQSYGTVVPTVDYVTSPATVAGDWTVQPACAVFATSDTSFTKPLNGVQSVGSYVTHCAGGISDNYVPTSRVNGTFTIGTGSVLVTAESPNSPSYGTAVPLVGYVTSPETVARDWDVEPTCGVYTTSDTAYQTPLTGLQPVGSYVTHCAGGTAKNFMPTNWVNGRLAVTKTPVVVTAGSPAAVLSGAVVPAVGYSTSPATVAGDWTVEPVCGAFAAADTTFATPLTGVQPAGSYVTHCTGGSAKNYAPTSWVNGTFTISLGSLVVTAASPTSVPYGTAVPAVGYSTSPATVAGDWTVEPVCGVFAAADTSSATPLTGVQPVGSYVTHCAGGSAKNFLPTSWVNGTFVVTKKPVVVTAASPTSVSYGTAVPPVGYSTSPATTPTDWSTEPSCSVFVTGDTSFVTPLTGIQPVGNYVTHCAGGDAENFVPTSWVNGTFAIVATAPGSVSTPAASSGSSQQVRVSFSPPNSGGSAITDYDVEYSTNASFVAGTGTFFEGGTTTAAYVDVTGLTNGTTYYFRIRATNAVGNGLWSAVSNAAIPFTTPGAPLNPSAARQGSQTVRVSFTVPASGGSVITDYDVEYSTNASFVAGTGTFFEGGTTTAAYVDVTGLTNGTTYYFRVRASNAAGNGAWSAITNGIAPQTASPEPPGSPSAARQASQTVRVSFAVPASGGSVITDYDVEYSTNASFVAGTGTFFEGGTTTAAYVDVTGLTNGTTYYFRVRASNAVGNGAWSAITNGAAPYTTPSAPGSPTAVRLASQTVRVSFSSPANGGSAIGDYDVEYSTTSKFTAGTGTFFEGGTTTAASVDVTGLTNGTTYYFRVRASNAAGNGAWSAITNGAAPYTTPSAPTNVTAARATATSVKVSFTAPSNGGSAITDYDVEYSTNATFTAGTGTFFEGGTTTTTSVTVTGLTTGTTYYFRVRATNAAGNSAWSTISNGVKP